MPYLIEVAPDGGAIYLAQKGGNVVYFTKNEQAQWSRRTCGVAVGIQDFAVENDDVSYAVEANGFVTKSTNDGFIWSAPEVNTTIGNAYSLQSVQTNVLLIGGAGNGKAGYSLDGGNTWTILPGTIETGATNVILTPDSSYGTNSNIYAATTQPGLDVMQWTIGTSTAWTDIYNQPGLPPPTSMKATQGTYGLAMKNGILYALTNEAATNLASLQQYIPPTKYWAQDYAPQYVPPVGATENVFFGSLTVEPNELQAVGATGSNTLWTIKTTGTNSTYSIQDTDAFSPPALGAPADKSIINANSLSGAANSVLLTWSRAATAQATYVQIAFDSAFANKLTTTTINFPTLNTLLTAAVGIQPGFTYYWRVMGTGLTTADSSVLGAPTLNGLESPWFLVQSFTIQPLPEAVPTISSPANGATITKPEPGLLLVAGNRHHPIRLPALHHADLRHDRTHRPAQLGRRPGARHHQTRPGHAVLLESPASNR